MMLGFQARFEKKILAKEKRHTIRDKRKGRRQWKVGDRADCYVNPRQKSMRLLGRWLVVKVQDIKIAGGWESYSGEWFGSIEIDGVTLIHDECEVLARADGFESYAEMMEFWRGRLPFHGDIIHWNPDEEPRGK